MGDFLSIAGETLMQQHLGGLSSGKSIVVDPPGFVRYWGSTTRGNGGSSIINTFTPTAAHRESGKRSTAKSDPSPYTNNRHHFPAGLNGQSKHSPVINDAGSPTVFPGRSIQNFPGPIHIFITVLKNIRILARRSANKFQIFFADIRDEGGRSPMFR